MIDYQGKMPKSWIWPALIRYVLAGSFAVQTDNLIFHHYVQPFNIEKKRYLNNHSYQKWTNWVEWDEIEVSEVRSTQSRGFLRVRSRVALHVISICTRQHNLLPVFPSGRSKRKIVSIVLPLKRMQNEKSVSRQTNNRFRYLKSTIRDWGNVWKLLFLVICVSESSAMRPNIYKTQYVLRMRHRFNLTSVSNVFDAAPRSLLWAFDGFKNYGKCFTNFPSTWLANRQWHF